MKVKTCMIKEETMGKGRACVLNNEKLKFTVKNYDVHSPDAGNVLLKMKRSGICGTDVHIHSGKLGMPGDEIIIGHELIGEIAELGPETDVDGLGNTLAVGDNAVACVAKPCGECPSCKREETASCMNFGVTYFESPETAPHFHGGFAEVLFSPAENLVRIPDGMDLDAVAAFPCAGPTVIRAMEYAGGFREGELVIVQGTGPMGLFAIAYAKASGCSVGAIGSSSHPKRMELAEKLGADPGLLFDYRNVGEEERLEKVIKAAEENGSGNGADLVIETSGAPEAVIEGMNLVRTRGRYSVPGQYSVRGGIMIQPELITFKALQIIGSGQYTLKDVGTYISFIENNPDLAALFAECLTDRFTLDQIDEAFGKAEAGDVIKAVFTS